MKKILYIFICLITYSASSEMFVDLNLFHKNISELNISFYIKKDELKFEVNDSAHIANIKFKVLISNKSNNKIDTFNWDYNAIIYKDKFNEREIVIGENILRLLDSNNYLIELTATNNDNILFKKNISVSTKLNYDPYISDLQLLFDVSQIDNKIKFTPNATNTISGTEPKLISYQEFYNLNNFIGKQLLIQYRMLDGAKREVFEQSKKIIISKNNISDIYEATFYDLPTGSYYYEVKMLNLDSSLIASKNKLIYLLNPETKPNMQSLFRESNSFEESVFASMTEKDIDLEFAKFKLILTEYEIDQFNKLSTFKAKQRAIYKYWYIRDTDTSTTINEKREDFKKRIEFTELNFGNGTENYAWKSERGRVVLKYGKPTVRNVYQALGNKVACEEWFYDDVKGGLYFYFVQRFSLNNFVLVHSNGIGEPKDPNWVSTYNPNIDTDESSRFKDPNNYQK